MPSSDVRSSKTSAQNARGKNFQKFTCSNFCGFIFRGFYFRILVVGCENRENSDLTKISRYTVSVSCINNCCILKHSHATILFSSQIDVCSNERLTRQTVECVHLSGRLAKTWLSVEATKVKTTSKDER